MYVGNCISCWNGEMYVMTVQHTENMRKMRAEKPECCSATTTRGCQSVSFNSHKTDDCSYDPVVPYIILTPAVIKLMTSIVPTWIAAFILINVHPRELQQLRRFLFHLFQSWTTGWAAQRNFLCIPRTATWDTPTETSATERSTPFTCEMFLSLQVNHFVRRLTLEVTAGMRVQWKILFGLLIHFFPSLHIILLLCEISTIQPQY